MPDATTDHNPGLDEHEWVRGIPRINTDDRGALADLLAARVPDWPRPTPRLPKQGSRTILCGVG